ncbi:hypothetical protein BDV93DRAFT_440386 [Ceratobasidium sp. AG-I]|nr:hypothetical protein BDV93DRAFT_440386 [Ceratobasidium sp. AG-I]
MGSVYGLVRSSFVKPGPDAFDVVELKGRGKGVVANRDIKQGELLIREKPLFIVPTRPQDPITLIQSKVSALSTAGQASFYALSYAKPNISDTHIPFEIFQTNAISAGTRGTGLFPRTARLNHGCSRAFSAVYSWREEEGVMVVHAIRDIKKGKVSGGEILTTYTDTKRPRADRQSYLREIYHFDCACEVCSLPPNESAASDRRLSTIIDLKNLFSMWGNGDIKGREAIKQARRIWALMETEGYLSERGQLAADAAQVAAAHKDADAARQWATLAHKWYSIELGEDSKQSKTVQKIIVAPETHAAWGTRPKETVGGPEEATARK